MEPNELKFILKLLGCANYQTPLTAKGFKDFQGRNKICQDLGDRGLVDYSREMATVKILPPGRALLKIKTSQLPISAKELKALEKIAKASKKIKPSEIKLKLVNASEREAILQSLSDRGLIEAEIKLKRTKAEVWLTERGQEYLRDEYNPQGNATISLDLLNNYLRFLRKSLQVEIQKPPPSKPTASGKSQPSDEQILQIIRDLDKELGTENYLPIFHLRQKLQPPLSREELDRVLYSLQRKDLIELSSLQDAIAYTPDQIDSGIPQDIGGSLFFISANE
jgi:hypothetical protein